MNLPFNTYFVDFLVTIFLTCKIHLPLSLLDYSGWLNFDFRILRIDDPCDEIELLIPLKDSLLSISCRLSDCILATLESNICLLSSGTTEQLYAIIGLLLKVGDS